MISFLNILSIYWGVEWGCEEITLIKFYLEKFL